MSDAMAYNVYMAFINGFVFSAAIIILLRNI